MREGKASTRVLEAGNFQLRRLPAVQCLLLSSFLNCLHGTPIPMFETQRPVLHSSHQEAALI